MAYGSKPSGYQGALQIYSVWDPALGTGDNAKQLLDNTTGTDIFTPADDKISRKSQPMAFQRWYATAVTTANGEQVVLGGRIDRLYEGDDKYPPTDDSYASTPEVYSAAQGWRTLKAAGSEFAYGSFGQSWNYAPPGFYLLFALDAQGVPSKARVLRLGA